MASKSDMEKFASYVIGRGNNGRDTKTKGVIAEEIIQSYARFLHENYYMMLSEDKWWFFEMNTYVSNFLNDMVTNVGYWRNILEISCTADDFDFFELIEVCSQYLAKRLQYYAAGRRINYTLSLNGNAGFRYE